LIRILVVEDFEPFRRFICSKLGKRQELQVVGEASDGLQAVQKAEELQPDLILLDIGLPTLNGIEAACRISRLVPAAKVQQFQANILRTRSQKMAAEGTSPALARLRSFAGMFSHAVAQQEGHGGLVQLNPQEIRGVL
jgi:DNA-binding NarL/FixJ family response regulator